MRVAVLAKQVPTPSELRLVEGQLIRTGVPLETSAYCRRANARAVELAGADGEVVVFTMGPPAAEAVLREMVACGADRGVLLSDPHLAGSDTLATSRALAAAIELEGPFDLVLCGAVSLDSETGHIGPQVAHLLGLPFIGPCRELDITDRTVVAKVEVDGGYQSARAALPLVASAAERLCSPSKASVEQLRAVAGTPIKRLTVEDLRLSPDDVGEAGSPTWVGDVRETGSSGTPVRARRVHRDLDQFIRALKEVVAASNAARTVKSAAPTRLSTVPSTDSVWCIPDTVNSVVDNGLVAATADLANRTGRRSVVVLHDQAQPGVATDCDQTVWFKGASAAAEDVAAALAPVLRERRPHAVLIEATAWGRELAARLATTNRWGLVGDAVSISIEANKLVPWKSAFSGQAVVSIGSNSPTLLITVRPGVLSAAAPDMGGAAPAAEYLDVPTVGRTSFGPLEGNDHEERQLMAATTVIAVGHGVDREDYPHLDELRQVIGAGPLGATRRVTDLGWLPRSRQIGITGRSVTPELLVSIGASGRFNHSAGFTHANTIVAINSDAEAAIFNICDIGVIGDWRVIVPEICRSLNVDAAVDHAHAS